MNNVPLQLGAIGLRTGTIIAQLQTIDNLIASQQAVRNPVPTLVQSTSQQPSSSARYSNSRYSASFPIAQIVTKGPHLRIFIPR
jgi:hypothetical protein